MVTYIAHFHIHVDRDLMTFSSFTHPHQPSTRAPPCLFFSPSPTFKDFFSNNDIGGVKLRAGLKLHFNICLFRLSIFCFQHNHLFKNITMSFDYCIVLNYKIKHLSIKLLIID